MHYIDMHYSGLLYLLLLSHPRQTHNLGRSVVTSVSVGVPALGPVEVLLNDGRLLLDIVSLGVLDGEAEVVKDGVNETDDGETD